MQIVKIASPAMLTTKNFAVSGDWDSLHGLVYEWRPYVGFETVKYN